MIPEYVFTRDSQLVQLVDDIYRRFDGGVWSHSATYFDQNEIARRIEECAKRDLLDEDIVRVVTVESVQQLPTFSPRTRPATRLHICSSAHHMSVISRDSISFNAIGGPNNRAFVLEVINALKLDLSQAKRRDLRDWK